MLTRVLCTRYSKSASQYEEGSPNIPSRPPRRSLPFPVATSHRKQPRGEPPASLTRRKLSSIASVWKPFFFISSFALAPEGKTTPHYAPCSIARHRAIACCCDWLLRWCSVSVPAIMSFGRCGFPWAGRTRGAGVGRPRAMSSSLMAAVSAALVAEVASAAWLKNQPACV